MLAPVRLCGSTLYEVRLASSGREICSRQHAAESSQRDPDVIKIVRRD